MNVFIVFVKYLGWIIAIWVRLVKIIEENGGPKILEGGPITKMIYIITKK